MKIPYPLIPATAAAAALSPSLALAQASNINAASPFAWSENTGYVNFRDAGDPPASSGAFFNITAGFARGFVWGENIGYLNLGAGAGPYANTDHADFGVNIAADGALSGFAWSENAGWVNFAGGALATPPNPARLDTAANRLRGYAWGENIGWINLDDNTVFVGVLDRADFNGDGFVDPDDLSDYISIFFTLPAESNADFNGDGFVDPDDLSDYIAEFFSN